VAKFQTSVVPHPTYCPDLPRAEFILFPNLETNLKGSLFQTKNEVEENAKRILRAITVIGFQERLQ